MRHLGRPAPPLPIPHPGIEHTASIPDIAMKRHQRNQQRQVPRESLAARNAAGRQGVCKCPGNQRRHPRGVVPRHEGVTLAVGVDIGDARAVLVAKVWEVPAEVLVRGG